MSKETANAKDTPAQGTKYLLGELISIVARRRVNGFIADSEWRMTINLLAQAATFLEQGHVQKTQQPLLRLIELTKQPITIINTALHNNNNIIFHPCSRHAEGIKQEVQTPRLVVS